MAAKAVALEEASRPAFAQYAAQIATNAQALANKLTSSGLRVLSGGTENHLVLIDVGPFALTGRQAEQAARESRITLNRNTIPRDPNGAWYTSGLRLGTPALTTLGMEAPEMEEVASILSLVLSSTTADNSKVKYTIKEQALSEAHKRVADLLSRFVLYPEIDVPFLQKRF
jgi:glycine hydroxymethyltransferase